MPANYALSLVFSVPSCLRPKRLFALLMLSSAGAMAAATVPATSTTTATTTPSASPTGWQTLSMKQASVQKNTLVLSQGRQRILISALSPYVIRVRHIRDASADWQAQDRSFAVIQPPASSVVAQVQAGKTESELSTSALTVKVRHQPFALEVLDQHGNSLDADDTARGTATAGESVRVWKRLRESDQIYGFGEKNGRLNRRGVGLGGSQFVMWNTDYYGYDASSDPLYVSIPFYMVLNQGRAHGLFFDNTFRSSFDVGREAMDLLSFGSSGGEMNYYLIAGPDPKQVLQRYTELTGRMPLPPRWSLGYQQSRWSYFPEARVREVAQEFRQRQIPADVLWLDIDYLQGFSPFRWNREYFPEPKKMLGDLRQQGFHVVSIVDAHPRVEPGYAVWDQGVAGNHFIKTPQGEIYQGKVWPSNDSVKPALSAFPDFTRAATRRWWGSLHQSLLDEGIAGIWNDMNEPAVWTGGINTMPLDMRHENEGRATDQREIHNVYGLLHSRATYEGLLALRPNQRPFVLTRASFAGGQRYAAVWTGDNTADWSTLRESLPLLLSMGISGMNFVGTDIGGFAGIPSAELYTRWLQAAVFVPFMRSHAQQGKPEQDPWSYGAQHEALNRQAIELRYRLLPHLYNLMEYAARTGVPVMRPMFMEFPQEWQSWNAQEQYMFGDDLLVAPVLQPAASTRSLYLPEGVWYDYWATQPTSLAGKRDITQAVTLSSIPLYARAGAFIFQQPVVQHTGQMPGQPLLVEVFPAEKSSREFYEDDGNSRAYLQGQYLRRQFSQQRQAGRITITVSAGAGQWQFQPRQLCLHLRATTKVKAVSLNGLGLAAQTQENQTGWRQLANTSIACSADSRETMRFEFEVE